jgi:hypothetical protein
MQIDKNKLLDMLKVEYCEEQKDWLNANTKDENNWCHGRTHLLRDIIKKIEVMQCK